MKITNFGFKDYIVNEQELKVEKLFIKNKQNIGQIKLNGPTTFYVIGGFICIKYGDNKIFIGDNEKCIVVDETCSIIGLRDSFIFCISQVGYEQLTKESEVSEKEFKQLITEFLNYENRERVLIKEQAKVVADVLHQENKTVGFVNGCFDLFHIGHVELLKQAKLRCDILFVGVNSDVAVKELKDEHRPYIKENERMGMVASCRYVDYVVKIGLRSFEMIDIINPNIYVTTDEYGRNGVEGKYCLEKGIEVDVIGKIEGISTTLISRKVKMI